jgi:hypothetical protein
MTPKALYFFVRKMKEDGSVSKVIIYGLDEWGLIPDRSRNFFPHCHIQTGCQAYPASYPISPGRLIF